MRRILNIILNRRNTFLFLFLLIIALAFTIQSHSYHQSKFFNSSIWVSGKLYKLSSNIDNYFDLKEQNKRLVAENEFLKKQLYHIQDSIPNVSDSLLSTYVFKGARVIKNSFALSKNYITIDKGSKDGIQQDMGVITPNGVLGIVENTSNRFASVQSILNTKSSLNAKIKNTDHFGSLIWNTKNYQTVQLTDIPRLVPLVIGDTVVTGGMSSIFPEGIPIGVVKKYNLNNSKSTYNIDVAPFTDMASIKNVYIIENKNRAEIIELEKTTENNVE